MSLNADSLVPWLLFLDVEMKMPSKAQHRIPNEVKKNPPVLAKDLKTNWETSLFMVVPTMDTHTKSMIFFVCY